MTHPLTAHEIKYPKFEGDIHFTSPNTSEFMQFVDKNLGKVVYFDLILTTNFTLELGYRMEEVCNSHFNFWDDGLANQNVFLPIYEPDPDNPPKEFGYEHIEKITCEALPIRFVDTDLMMSSAGPGTHWFNIEGFFLLRSRAERWPFIELKELPASAEAWAIMKN